MNGRRTRRLVTRDAHARPWRITTVVGAVVVRQPRANDRRVDPDTGERARFRSSLIPPWCQERPRVTEVVPLRSVHGLSTGDFAPALERFVGSLARPSVPAITWLTRAWGEGHRSFMGRDRSDRDVVYVFADVVHVNARLKEDQLCCPVVIGVRLDGTKEPDAVTDGYQKSNGSWAAPRDLRHHSMRAPVLGVGDGALGFQAVLRDVRWPTSSLSPPRTAGGRSLVRSSSRSDVPVRPSERGCWSRARRRTRRSPRGQRVEPIHSS